MTVTPSAAVSSASARVSPTMPAFAAAYETLCRIADDDTGHRRDHHHPAPAGDAHVRQHGARDQERAAEVAGEGVLEPAQLDVHDVAVTRGHHGCTEPGHARAVDQHGHRAELRAGGVDDVRDLVRVAQVGDGRGGRHAERRQLARAVVRALGGRGDRDRGTQLGECARAGEADALRRTSTGYQRDPTGQVQRCGQCALGRRAPRAWSDAGGGARVGDRRVGDDVDEVRHAGRRRRGRAPAPISRGSVTVSPAAAERRTTSS